MHAVLGSGAQLDPHTGPALTSEPQFPRLGSGVGICLLCGVVGEFIQHHMFITSLPPCASCCEAGCRGCGESRWISFLIGCQCPPELGRRCGCQAWVYSRHPINIRFFLSSRQVAPPPSSHPHPDFSGPQPGEAAHPPAGLLPHLHFRWRNELESRAPGLHPWPPHARGPAGACLGPSLSLFLCREPAPFVFCLLRAPTSSSVVGPDSLALA